MDTDETRRPLRGWRFLLLNVAVGLANVVVLSNVPGYTISGPYVAGNLQGVTPSFASWGSTDHLIGISLGFPIARWLAARYGDYLVYVTALAVYAGFSLLCAQSETIWSFVPMRILLGMTAGVILPTGQAVLLGEYPAEKRTFGVGIWAILSMMPFTIGVFMGGFWSEYVDWQALFYSNVFITLGIAAITGSLVYGRRIKRYIRRFDTGGYLMLAIILLGTQTIFNQGNDFDWFGWSWFMFGLLLTVIATLPCFIIWELGERNPILDLRLFAYRNYTISVICSVAGFLVIQGLLSLFSVQLQVLLGYSSSLAGIVYLSMMLLSFPLVMVLHEICQRVDVRLVACACFLWFSATLTWMGLFDRDGWFDQIALPMIFFGFSLAAFFTPLAELAIYGLPARLLQRGGEELTLLRTMAGGFGIALQGVVMFRRTPFHQLDLADHFGGRRFASLDLLSLFSDKLQAAGVSADKAQHIFGNLILEQSSLLGMNDAFLLGGVIFAMLAAFVWLASSTIVPTELVEKLQKAKAEEMMEQG
ncbi:MAG TPA: MFS transporter [Methylocella sp.]|nr:MFS transporter [Methylocella sp.]